MGTGVGWRQMDLLLSIIRRSHICPDLSLAGDPCQFVFFTKATETAVGKAV